MRAVARLVVVVCTALLTTSLTTSVPAAPSTTGVPADPVPTDAKYYVAGVQASAYGVAWADAPNGVPADASSVYYSVFGGAQNVYAGNATLTDISATGYGFSLQGKQLYLTGDHGVETGIDITTGLPLPEANYCTRTGNGCLAILADYNGTYHLTYSADSTQHTREFAPPLDPSAYTFVSYSIRAIDSAGAVLRVDSLAGLTNWPLLTYLDFKTGRYTTLDGTGYADDSYLAMDSDYIVWTHWDQQLYLERADLSAAPRIAAPDATVVRESLNGDTLAYTTISPDDGSDGPHSNTVYVGAIGGADFTPVAGQFCSTVAMVPLDGGDFAAIAGSTAGDYGLYRVATGQHTLGAAVVIFGFPINYVYSASDDFCGNGQTTAAVIDSSHTWSIDGSSAGAMQYGAPGDILAVTDNAGGQAQVGVFRPSNGTWYVRHDATSTSTQWGGPGDIPVPAHYAGVSKASVIATFRPSNGTWYIRGISTVQWGRAGDVPVPGHYFGTDADGYADQPAVFRPSNGYWYVRGHPAVHYGRQGDIPVPGDYDGDGTTDIAVYRPSTHTWYVRGQAAAQWGGAGDVPLTGDFNGDGKADIAVYRPSTATWYLYGHGSFRYGQPGNTPVEGRR